MTLERTNAHPAAADAPVAYEKAIRMHAAAGVVYDAVTTARGLSAWWTRAAGSGKTGGELQLFMNAPEPLTIRVDRATRPTSVAWTVLDCPFLPDWVGTRPRFTIVPVGAEECELRFRHRGLTAELVCFDMCTRGWDHFLGSLRDYAAAGRGSPLGSAADRARRVAEAADHPAGA